MRRQTNTFMTTEETIMAFLPDEAARSGREVSTSARVLYEVLCSHRNWGDGLAKVGAATAIAESGLSRSTFFEAKRELITKGWIKETGAGIRCAKGEFKRQSRIRTDQSENQTRIVRISDYEVQNPDSLLMNNQPHVNQPHEPVHVAALLFTQILGTAPTEKDALAISQTVTDYNQWIETLSYWNGKNHRPSNVAGMLDNYRRRRQAKARAYVGQSQSSPNQQPATSTPDLFEADQELEALLRSLPQDEYERLYAEGRLATLMLCPEAQEWSPEQRAELVETWMKEQLNLKRA